MKINGIFIGILIVVVTLFSKTTDACGSKKTKIITTTEDPNRCARHDDCKDYEQCLMNRCTDICDFELVSHAPNAVCYAKGHVPYYKCPTDYEGSGFMTCTKNCTSTMECSYSDVCNNGKCVHGCETLKCGPEQYCNSEDHKPKCHIITR